MSVASIHRSTLASFLWAAFVGLLMPCNCLVFAEHGEEATKPWEEYAKQLLEDSEEENSLGKSALATLYASSDRIDEAIRWSQAIAEESARNKCYADVVFAIALSGNGDAALAFANQLGEPTRSLTMKQVVLASSVTHNFALAKKAAGEIQIDYVSSMAWDALARSLADSGRYEEAMQATLHVNEQSESAGWNPRQRVRDYIRKCENDKVVQPPRFGGIANGSPVLVQLRKYAGIFAGHSDDTTNLRIDIDRLEANVVVEESPIERARIWSRIAWHYKYIGDNRKALYGTNELLAAIRSIPPELRTLKQKYMLLAGDLYIELEEDRLARSALAAAKRCMGAGADEMFFAMLNRELAISIYFRIGDWDGMIAAASWYEGHEDGTPWMVIGHLCGEFGKLKLAKQFAQDEGLTISQRVLVCVGVCDGLVVSMNPSDD